MPSSAALYRCEIQASNLLSSKILQVILHFTEAAPSFYAGQYLLLNLKIDDKQVQLPYSIANAPAAITGSNKHQLELYIANNKELSEQVMAQLKASQTLHIEMPFGDCIITPSWLQQHRDNALIMLASGSGFSQIKSLCEATFALAPEQEVHIYWSNSVQEDFYLNRISQDWQNTYPNCVYHPVLKQAQTNWQGKNGAFHDLIAQDFKHLKQAQVFACGSPNMVYTTFDNLKNIGLSRANMHSDVFAYAPR